MTDKLLTAPVAMAVSIEAARIAARTTGTALDSTLESRVRTITAEAEHITGRAFITRTRRVTLDRFCDAIRLDVAPVISVIVRYVDPEGEEKTLHPDDYYADLVTEPSYLVPAVGTTWPTTIDRVNAVNVDYVCGYGETATTVPQEVQGYILAKVEEHFAHAGQAPSPDLVRSLDGLKVYG